MGETVTDRPRVHRFRALVLIVPLVIGTGCAAGGDGDGAAISEGTARSNVGPAQVIPSPLTTGTDGNQGRDTTARRPPLPNLTGRPSEMPPNTLSLEDLHRQGQTHVLR